MRPLALKWRAAVACVVFALVLAASPVHAQAHAAQAAGEQIVPPLLPDGTYDLTLTPASVQQRVLTSAPQITITAQVAHFGADVTIITSDGMLLHGVASPTHLKATGAVQRSALTLELGGSRTNASGTLLLAAPTGQHLTGTATVAPASQHTARSPTPRCTGFWACVKSIAGFDWSVFGD